jgi:hypothetical protein
VAHRAATSGLPAPAVVGIGFAVDPGVGQSSAPVRSAILGVSLAVVVLVIYLVVHVWRRRKRLWRSTIR